LLASKYEKWGLSDSGSRTSPAAEDCAAASASATVADSAAALAGLVTQS